MVMFWQSSADRLTEEEKKQIEEISHRWAWLNYDKRTGTYRGTFYYFPRNSGYKDSPLIPAEIAEQHKVRFLGLEHGWLNEKDKSFTDLEAVACMFPEEMKKLHQRFEAKIKPQAKINEEHVK